MTGVVQRALLAAYELAYRSGALSTGAGWRFYCASYRWYKGIADNDIRALRAFVTPGSLVLDIGANVGASALRLAKWVGDGGRVIAIEPEARNAAELRRVVAASPVGRRIEIIEAAASAEDGFARLALNELNPGDHRIAAEGAEVKTIRVDTLMSSHPELRLSAIKIDVQGAEPLVIAGARQAIERFKPVLFSEVFEDGLVGFGYSVERYLEMLEQLGYMPHVAAGTAVHEVSAAEVMARCARHGYTDVLFVPRTKK